MRTLLLAACGLLPWAAGCGPTKLDNPQWADPGDEFRIEFTRRCKEALDLKWNEAPWVHWIEFEIEFEREAEGLYRVVRGWGKEHGPGQSRGTSVELIGTVRMQLRPTERGFEGVLEDFDLTMAIANTTSRWRSRLYAEARRKCPVEFRRRGGGLVGYFSAYVAVPSVLGPMDRALMFPAVLSPDLSRMTVASRGIVAADAVFVHLPRPKDVVFLGTLPSIDGAKPCVWLTQLAPGAKVAAYFVRFDEYPNLPRVSFGGFDDWRLPLDKQKMLFEATAGDDGECRWEMDLSRFKRGSLVWIQVLATGGGDYRARSDVHALSVDSGTLDLRYTSPGRAEVSGARAGAKITVYAASSREELGRTKFKGLEDWRLPIHAQDIVLEGTADEKGLCVGELRLKVFKKGEQIILQALAEGDPGYRARSETIYVRIPR